MTNYRVLPVMLLTILATAGSGTAQLRKAQPPSSVRSLRVSIAAA